MNNSNPIKAMASLVLIMAIQAGHAAEYVGVGEAACPEFSIRRSIDSTHETAFVAWMQGYLASLNQQAFKAGKPQRQIPAEPLLYEALVKYCRNAGPLNDSLDTAVLEIYAKSPLMR